MVLIVHRHITIQINKILLQFSTLHTFFFFSFSLLKGQESLRLLVCDIGRQSEPYIVKLIPAIYPTALYLDLSLTRSLSMGMHLDQQMFKWFLFLIDFLQFYCDNLIFWLNVM